MPNHRSMGSLGWCQCYWCWRWEYNMYIPDGVGGPLCGDCLDLVEPPWVPNNRQRAEIFFEALCRTHWVLGDPAISSVVASYLAHPCVPCDDHRGVSAMLFRLVAHKATTAPLSPEIRDQGEGNARAPASRLTPQVSNSCFVAAYHTRALQHPPRIHHPHRRKATRSHWIQPRSARMALTLLQVARSKRLEALAGHHLQYLKTHGIAPIHRGILRTRWSVRGANRCIVGNNGD